TQQKWDWIDYVAWLSDSKGLVLTGTQQTSAMPQVWYLSYPGGEARKITNDTNSYHGATLIANSSTLATVQYAEVSNIWTVPTGDSSQAIELTSGAARYDGAEGIAWTADGKILFRTWAKRTNDLWIMDRDGGNARQLMVDDFDGADLAI